MFTAIVVVGGEQANEKLNFIFSKKIVSIFEFELETMFGEYVDLCQPLACSRELLTTIYSNGDEL